MCWCNHKEKEDCLNCQECMKEQTECCNQYAASTAAATVGNSQWNYLIANVHCNMADERLIRPAWTWWTTYWLLPMTEVAINDVQHAPTYILLSFLLIIFKWFGSLLTTTATSPQDHRHSTLWMSWVASHTPPNSPFSLKASQEDTLHEITLAGEQGTSMSCTIPTFTHGAHLPPPSSHHCLKGWLMSQAFP